MCNLVFSVISSRKLLAVASRPARALAFLLRAKPVSIQVGDVDVVGEKFDETNQKHKTP